MKVPQINYLGSFGALKTKIKKTVDEPNDKPLPIGYDTVVFSAKSKYVKKYNTLPKEIKEVLSPKDAIDMFQNIDFITKGQTKGKEIGQGDSSTVYENPWLKGYDLLILNNPKSNEQIIYSTATLGNSVWYDTENPNVQIIRNISAG